VAALGIEIALKPRHLWRISARRVRANCQLAVLPLKLAALLGAIHGVAGDRGVVVVLGLSLLNSSGKSVSRVDSAIDLLSPLDASARSYVVRAEDRRWTL